MFSIPTRTIVTAGALALAAALPAAAQAATITYEGDTLVYRAAPGEVNATGPSAGVVDTARLAIGDRVPITLQTGRCVPAHDWFECDMPAKVVFDLGDGDDHASFSSAVPGVPAEVYGGDGEDLLEGFTITGWPHAQLLDGGAGNDKIDGDEGADVVRGGPGDDEVTGGAGDDVVEGGDGADTLYPDGFDDPGTDTVDGGAGFDVVSDYDQPSASSHPRLSISFDGQANDGRPGENDNLVGVEKLDLSVSGTFAGGAGNDEFFVRSSADQGDSTVTGAGGDDRLTGHDHVEAIDGGAGADRIEGGFGNDALTGGPGRDTIFGDSTADTCNLLSCRVPFGNDVIDARDGEVDTIDCGVGEDRVTADAIDVLAGCEQVDTGGGTGPGGQGPMPGKLTGPSRFSRRQLRRGIRLEHTCAAACKVTVKLVAGKAVAKRLRARTIAKGGARRAGAGVVLVRARLTKAAAKRIGRLRKGKATLKVAVRQGGVTERFAKPVSLTR